MMRTPETVLNFTQQTWLQAGKDFQALQADVTKACTALGFPQAVSCTLIFDHGVLNIRATAALASRLRQLKPEIFQILTRQGWAISDVIFSVQKHNDTLQQHINEQLWVNPNETRYGKRAAPTAEQRAALLQFVQARARGKV
jgi:hypothetical protein